MSTTTAETPTTPPATGHTQYVFVYPCGCPRTVVDADTVDDAEEAWKIAAPLGAERKWLGLQGVTQRVMTDDEYAELASQVRRGCPHRNS